MPSSPGTSLLVLGAILSTVSDVAGCGIAMLGFAWEAFLFYKAGRGV